MKKILAYFTASVLALASLPYSAGAAEFDPFPPGGRGSGHRHHRT